MSNSLWPHEHSPPGFSVHGFSRQEYWSGLPFTSPGDHLDPQIRSRSPALWADSLPTEPLGKPYSQYYSLMYINRVFIITQRATAPISVQFSCSVMSDSLWPHGLHYARLLCPSLTPGAYSNSCPSNQWYNSTTSSSIIPFSSCLQSFPGSQSFQISQFFASDGQSIAVSA